MTSKDMKTWSDMYPLGASATAKLDVIDSCIAFEDGEDGGAVVLIYKDEVSERQGTEEREERRESEN